LVLTHTGPFHKKRVYQFLAYFCVGKLNTKPK
jgi:hypothetical protein